VNVLIHFFPRRYHLADDQREQIKSRWTEPTADFCTASWRGNDSSDSSCRSGFMPRSCVRGLPSRRKAAPTARKTAQKSAKGLNPSPSCSRQLCRAIGSRNGPLLSTLVSRGICFLPRGAWPGQGIYVIKGQEISCEPLALDNPAFTQATACPRPDPLRSAYLICPLLLHPCGKALPLF